MVEGESVWWFCVLLSHSLLLLSQFPWVRSPVLLSLSPVRITQGCSLGISQVCGLIWRSESSSKLSGWQNSFLAIVKLRDSIFSSSPWLWGRLGPSLKGTSDLIGLTLPFDLSRLLAVVINLLETLTASAESLHLCRICPRNDIHHLCHIHMVRSKLLLMSTLTRCVGHWGHLRILPTSLGKHQLSTNRYSRMAEGKVVHNSVRPKDKADLSSIPDRLASWSFTSCQLLVSIPHQMCSVCLILQSSNHR